jgi:hypothetical protein
MHKVAIIITVYRNPPRLAALVDNMKWAGIPDIPIYVFEDPSPFEDREEITAQYKAVCKEKGNLHMFSAPKWGCMHGIIDFAFRNTFEPWIIYIPDDVLFTRGGLWNEYAGVLTYGREWVGGIQAPYWNAQDLVNMGILAYKDKMYQDWLPDSVPRNPHWDHPGVPRRYINLNGAGFSLSRALFNVMGGWPAQTWRLDEYAGYMAWKEKFAVITLPGPPRIHYFGGTTPQQPQGRNFHTVDAWVSAVGKTPQECGIETTLAMEARFPQDDWDSMLKRMK